MKRLISAAILCLITFQASRADEPPSWNEFAVESANKKCIAKVAVKDKMGKEQPWNWSYTLSVYKAADRDKPIWSSNYDYDGNPGGQLSDDGTTFARISFWYYESSPVVSIYKDGKLAKAMNGKDFPVDKSKLERTVSHQLWWAKQQSPRLEGNKELVIPAIDGQTFRIDLEKLRLKE